MAEELENKEVKIEEQAAEEAKETPKAEEVPAEGGSASGGKAVKEAEQSKEVEEVKEEAAKEEAEEKEEVKPKAKRAKPKKEKAKEEEPKEDKAPGDDKKWYVVQTYSGQEDRVKESIERNVNNMNMSHKISRILVPTEETVELKDGKRVEKVRKMFPGYVFIEMLLDDESWYVIRGTPGVAKFIGTKVSPTPVLDKEMQRVLKQIGVKEEKLEIAFERGESVRIISGPFRGYTGSIDEVNAQKGKLKTLISIFGRDTPVEVNFEQVQKIV